MRYKIEYEYYAGMGENGTAEQIYNSREEMLQVLNNVFKDDIMIAQLKVTRLLPTNAGN